MVGSGGESERQHLLAVAGRLDDLLAEVARVSRRLRNARLAVHALEDELVRLCEDVRSRADALGEGER